MKKNKGLGLSRKKEFYLSLFLSLLVLITLFVVNTTTTYINGKEETLNKIDLVTDNVEKNITRTLSTIDNVSKNIFLSETFQIVVEELYDENLYNSSIEKINTIFENNLRGFDSLLIKDICYIPRDLTGNLDITNLIHYGYNVNLFVNKMDANIDKVLAESVLDENVNGSLFLNELYSFGNLSDQVAFSRNIKSVRNQNYNEKMGIGIIVINKTRLIELLNYSNVVDGLVSCISYNETISFYSSGIDNLDIDFKKDIISEISLGFYDWKMTSYYDRTYFLISLEETLFTSLIIVLFFIAVYIVLYFNVHKKNLKSVYYMFDNFSQITKETQLRQIKYIDDVEINKVILAYNEMVDTMNTLNNNILLEKEMNFQYQLQKKNFEIKSLYAQINKHFIINVLSIIHSLINLKQIDNANYCLENLSDFLRYSLTLDSSSCLKDEINNVISYFNIQAIRYSKVNYSIDYDDDIDDIIVPKLIIQPLVENAYIHGLKNKVGCISVYCKKDNDMLRILVIDDGKSLKNEDLHEINEKIRLCDEIESNPNLSHGIALSNIQKRLNLMYGDNARLKLKILDDDKTMSAIEIKLR